MMLTHSRLKEVLSYHKKTGVFFWKISTGKAKRGGIAGHTDSNGYTKISVDGVKYFAHRLAWFYCYKKWPERNIDHIDRCRSNNRLANLRDVSQSVNGLNGPVRKNNTSGYVGVSFDRRRSNWAAYLNTKAGKKHVGTFSTSKEAGAARQAYLANLLATDTRSFSRSSV